ncbi:MAG: DUF5627 domain-containing protein [Mariniphaga sp.]|nr:DUF5627 domain-containing protein [Mariniphaga sp.]MDD4425260.1 DUF5627 domain-containing protein [Mariniphaga sp.]
MKKIIAIISLLVCMAGMFSCENDDWSFPDFDYTTAYFPYQYPVRTLILGDYMYDNSYDNNLKFKIGATMGGVYENKKDVVINFQVDPGLIRNLYNATGNTPILALPQNYYTLSSNNEIVIPKGEFSGSIDVQLSEAFFQDELSVGVNYVIPLKITQATTDSILVGMPGVSNPDPRVAGDWVLPPKNFTLFAIKYINEYDAKYLLRGHDQIKDAANNVVDEITYRDKYVERDEIVNVKTVARHVARYSNNVRSSEESPGTFTMDMTFGSEGNCTITEADGSEFPVSGTGKFVKNGDSWGGEKRNVLYLDYIVDDGVYTHHVKDTLVFRNRTVTIEQFSPSVQK